MLCEVCGMDAPYTRSVSIEGTVLRVCSQCAKFGVELKQRIEAQGNVPDVAERLEARDRRMKERDVFVHIPKEDLVADFSQRIRKAREARTWTQEELGKKINEKKSVITQLETGAIRPNDKLIEKIEHCLSIKLKEKVEEVEVRQKKGSQPLTLGDLIKIEKEK